MPLAAALVVSGVLFASIDPSRTLIGRKEGAVPGDAVAAG
jgi:hypothetical protein